jgi:hypothetical protein
LTAAILHPILLNTTKPSPAPAPPELKYEIRRIRIHAAAQGDGAREGSGAALQTVKVDTVVLTLSFPDDGSFFNLFSRLS